MRPLNLIAAISLLLGGAGSQAADFQFSSILRAGLPNAGDWELGIGSSAGTPASTAHLNPYYLNDTPQTFQIGYQQSTNTAFLRFYNQPSGYTQVNYAIPFSVAPGTQVRWEIPTGSLYVRASRVNRPTSVTIDQLALTGGVTILQPLSATSLTAFQSNSQMTSGTTAPVVFVTAGSGDWTLSGRIRFAGLSPYAPGGARRSQLHMGFTVQGTAETPDAPTVLTMASGLLALGLLRGRFHLRRTRP